ncbi:MAG: MG2 domain-containing protein, partial [Planctomycetota bacterium]|nr:MG2 domain-containing protein [Planctomycetota bacterium]
MKRLLLPLAFCLAAPLAPASPAPQSAEDLPRGVPDEVHAPLLSGRPDELDAALETLAELSRDDQAPDGTWRYLEALTTGRLGKLEEAVAQLVQLETDFPDGPYAKKARYQRAGLLAELGRFAEAQAILGQAAIELRADERRDDLAQTCLAMVRSETELDPAAPTDPNRLNRVRAALQLLTEVRELHPTAAVERELLRLRADFEEQLDAHQARVQTLRAWLELATDLPAAEQHEVRLELGIAQGRHGDFAAALATLDLLSVELVQAGQAGGDLAARIDLQRAEMRTKTGGTQNLEDAIAILEAHLSERPSAPGRTQAAFDIAELHARLGRDADALAAWQRLLDLARPEAANIAERESDANLRMESRWRIAQTYQSWAQYEDAIAGYAEYIALFPAGPHWGACQSAIIDAQYAAAQDLEQDGQYADARRGLLQFLDDHPVDRRVVEVQRLFADSFAHEAEDLQDDSPDAAAALWRRSIAELELLAKKHAGGDAASHALFTIGLLQETRLEDLDAAISAFRRCNFGSHQWDASMRLAEMLEQHLSIETPATWRPGAGDGAPSVRLTTRNLEEVSIELYRLDLESYYRRHRSNQGVVDLDLDLIQSDETFTHKITVTQRHARVVEEVALPLDGPGAWVVVAVSETERATTLVLSSDLDLVVESNREEALVLVQDRVLRQPLAGARVLVAGTDGGALFEGVTGPDGVARVPFGTDGLAPRGRLSALVEKHGHLASVGLDLSQGDLAPKAAPAGYVYTERTTYRAGERVHWRAILRQPDGAKGWSFEPGTRIDVTLYGPLGLQLHTEQLALGEFGTASGTIELPTAAPEGSYSLQVHDGSSTFTQQVSVREFETPHTRLVVEPGALVLLPGQTQTFDLTATLAHGAPLADARIVGHLGRGTTLEVTATTDAEGHARLEVPLEAIEGAVAGGTVAWSFRLLGEEVPTAGRFYIAAREFELELETARSLYLADETFGLDLTTRDLAGKPTSRRLTLQVLRLVPDPTGRTGRTVELPVSSAELQTSSDGTTRTELRLEEGGVHVLRAAGLDALGNPVSRELRVTISDEDDEQRLRFLVERSRYELGEEVALRLHNRTEPGPCLVVFEGDGILDYRVIDLAEGDNTIAFEASMLHWPNTTLRADLIGDERLHRVSQELSVTRGLKLELETGGSDHLPGTMADLALRLVDGLGNPVQGEFSVALVDAAFLDRFPDNPADPAELFESRRRRVANLVAATSAGFRYAGVTREISAAVLAEAERQQQSQEYRQRLADARGFLASAEDKDMLGALGYAAHLAMPEEDFEGVEFNDVIGVGGGAGGKFGGRVGGRRNLRAAGGASAGPDQLGMDEITAMWRGDIVTDADGRASLALPMPSRGGAWRLGLRGVDKLARTVTSFTELTTSAPLLVELELPSAVGHADTFEVVARLHHRGSGAGSAELRLVVTGLGAERVLERQVRVDGAGSHTVSFGSLPVELGAQPQVRFRLEAELQPDGDGDRLAATTGASLRVRSMGVALVDSAGGDLSSPVAIDLQLDAERIWQPTLEVFVGSDLGAELLETILGRGPFAATTRSIHPSTQDLAQDLLGAATLRQALRDNRSPRSTAELDRRLRGLVAELVARQDSQGGWPWAEVARAHHSSDPRTSAWCLLALSEAAEQVPVPAAALGRGRQHVASQLQGLSASSEDPRALLLHALAAAGAIDHDKLSGLFRTRTGADAATLAHLTLAYASLGRSGEAGQLADLLDARSDGAGGFGALAPWCLDELRTTALCVWALTQGRPTAAAIGPASQRLVASDAWSLGRHRGLNVTALAHGATDGAQGELRVALSVDGGAPIELRVPRGRATAMRSIPLPDYQPGTQVRVSLRGAEDGRRDGQPATWHARLTARGQLPAQRSVQAAPVLAVSYSAPPQRVQTPAGSIELRNGFSILGQNGNLDSNRWVNELTHLELGQRAVVQVRPSSFPARWDHHQSFIEYEIPLPAGTQVVEGSLQGVQWSQRDGSLWVRSGSYGTAYLNFQILGTAPGEYHVAPPRLWVADAPAKQSYGAHSELTVLGAGIASPDEYLAPPDEVFDRGMHHFATGDLDQAHDLLGGLHERFAGLFADDAEAKLAEVLLALSIRAGDAPKIVLFFESLIEHEPEHYLTLDEVVAIGEAYRDLGEHERALALFQATVAETFATDLRIAGALDRFGDFSGSLAILNRLWRDFPDLPLV